MNLRMTTTAAAAVLLASLSLTSVVRGGGWLLAGIGAVVIVGAAGMAARMPAVRVAAVATAATLVAVVPLLSAPGWGLRAVGLILVGLAALSATGQRLLRGVGVLACYLAGLFVYLSLVFANGPAFGHLVPSYACLAVLGREWHSAFAEFQFSPPVPDTSGVSLVAAAGIGLIAIAVDLTAVRLRRPALAGLPLLVLFSVPVASNLQGFGARQVLTFAAAMAGFLGLLSTAGRERLRLWGRLVTGRRPGWGGAGWAGDVDPGPDTRDLAASGRRIGLVAVCLAVLIPLALPTLHPHDVFATSGSGTGGGGHGSGGVGALNALLSVQQQLDESKPRPVLTYKTSATNADEQYFQVLTLNYNPGRDAWLPEVPANLATLRQLFPSHGTTSLPYPPQGQEHDTPASTVTTTVSVNSDPGLSGGASFLPVPYAPTRIQADAPCCFVELPGSLMLYDSAVQVTGLHYTVTSTEADPTAADILASSTTAIPAAIGQYTSYTGPDAAKLAAIARQHTAGATTQLQEAQELQSWFQSGQFTYTLNPKLPSSHWLLSFLTTNRKGYCQQFAWAFAVLARELGIPSRVVVGYTAGTPTSDNRWLVTTADAHAWPELFFAGQGWLRFEPTPQGDPDAGQQGQGTATMPTYTYNLPGSTPQQPQASPTQALGSAAGAAAAAGAASRLLHANEGGGGQARSAGGMPGSWLAGGIGLLVVLLAASPALTRQLTRRRRWLAGSGDAQLASAAWRELTDDLTDYGLAAPGETPRTAAARVQREARLDPAAAAAMRRIAAAQERARYALRALPGAGLASDGRTVRRAIAASVPRARRVRALLLPTSTLLGALGLLQRTGDMLNWLDIPWPAAARRLRRMPHGGRPEQA